MVRAGEGNLKLASPQLSKISQVFSPPNQQTLWLDVNKCMKPFFLEFILNEIFVFVTLTSESQLDSNPLHHPDYFDVHQLVKMRELFNARVHMGHHEGCWNPLMKPYLIGTREHYHVINLNETVRHLKVSVLLFSGPLLITVLID